MRAIDRQFRMLDQHDPEVEIWPRLKRGDAKRLCAHGGRNLLKLRGIKKARPKRMREINEALLSRIDETRLRQLRARMKHLFDDSD